MSQYHGQLNSFYYATTVIIYSIIRMVHGFNMLCNSSSTGARDLWQ